MKNTKTCMLNLLGEVANAKIDDVTLLTTLSEDAQVAKVFIDQFNYLVTLNNKYYSIDNDTKVSIILENIYKACQNFDPAKGNKLSTLAIFYITNDFKRYIRDQENDKRIANQMKAEDMEDDRGMKVERLEEGVCDDTSKIEILNMLKSINFTETEKFYIKSIIEDNNIKDAEIAKELSCARCTITKMKKGLKSKLEQLGYAI